MKNKKKIIITGASGNLGFHLTKSIKDSVLKIDRQNWNELNKIDNEEYEFLIHCAYDLKNEISEHPSIVLESNVIATAKLLEICKIKKIKTFVFISSCAVYGDNSNSSEEKTPAPITMNGHIKAFNEEIVKMYCKSNNINYLIFRPFNSYGGNDTFSVVQRIINCAVEKSTLTLINNGIAERDFIHVKDVAEIISILIEKNLRNEIINIGSGESVKIFEIVKAIEDRFGKIKIENKINNYESIYSRANLKKLNSILQLKTINIFEYIKNLK